MDLGRPLTLGALLVAVGLLLGGAGAVAAQEGSSAPATTVSADGRAVTDGSRSLSASQTQRLDPAGQVVSVSGTGFPVDRGIYVAFCVIPPTDQRPSPCGGGRGDQSTDTGSSLWFGTYPPGSGKDAATPYGPGGSFSGTLAVAPDIAPGLDCRQLRCAIVTRADHTRTSDRSLDLFLPVTFAVSSPAGATATTAPPPAPTVTTTIPPLQPSQVAPVTTVGPDGRAVGDGTRRLEAQRVADLDPGGARITVSGRGFDTGRGIYLALCAVPSPAPGLPPGAATAPGPCTAGSEEVARWVSSNPPAYGRDLAAPYGDGGSFHAELTLRAKIDDDHDCRQVPCAIATRNDDTAPEDRTQDLLLPVSFASQPSPTDGRAADPGAARSASADARAGAGPVVAGVGALALLAVGGAVVVRRRAHRGAPTPDAR